MPNVPEYGANRVQEQGLPNIRVNDNVPIEALGGGQSAANVTSSGIGLNNAIASAIKEEQQRADQIAHVNFQAKMSGLETDMLYGRDGVMHTRGENAMASPANAMDNFDKRADEYVSSLTTHAQKEAGAIELKNRRDQFYGKVLRHVASESERFDDDSTNSAVKNFENLGIMAGDENSIKQAHVDIRQTLMDYADRKGLGDQARFGLVSSASSKLDAGVVEDLIKNNKPNEASAYYDENKDFILPPDRQRLEGGLSVGKNRAQAQTIANDILSKFSDDHTMSDGTYASPYEMAAQKTGNNEEIQAMVESTLKRSFQNRKDVGEQIYNDRKKNGFTQAIQNPGVPASISINAMTYSGMEPGDKKTADRLANPPVKENMRVYSNLIDGLRTGELGTMSDSDFYAQYAKLNQSQRTEVLGLRKGAREDALNPSAPPQTAFQRNVVQTVYDVAKMSGVLDQGDKRSDAEMESNDKQTVYGEFYQDVKRQTDYLESSIGRKATPKEVEGIAVKLAQKIKVPQAHFWSDNEKYVFHEMTSYNDIPSNAKTAIEKSLRANRQIPTKSAVENIYASRLKVK